MNLVQFARPDLERLAHLESAPPHHRLQELAQDAAAAPSVGRAAGLPEGVIDGQDEARPTRGATRPANGRLTSGRPLAQLVRDRDPLGRRNPRTRREGERLGEARADPPGGGLFAFDPAHADRDRAAALDVFRLVPAHHPESAARSG